MSKDSSPTYIHFHHPRLADLFEDFNRPHTSTAASTTTNNTTNNPSSSITNPPHTTGAHNHPLSPPAHAPSFLPIEDILVLPQYQPVNPEDEDDVVPDQHAAFGIARAMDGRREVVWRDLGLEELMRGMRLGRGGGVGLGVGRGLGEGELVGSRARRMRRVVCLR